MLNAREATTRSAREIAKSAIANFSSGCKNLFRHKTGKLPPGVPGMGTGTTLLDGFSTLASYAYFYAADGPESNLSFRQLGLVDDSMTIGSILTPPAKMATAFVQTSSITVLPHIVVDPKYWSLDKGNQYSIVLHEFLHVLLNLTDHKEMLMMLGVNENRIEELEAMNGDILTTFIAKDCKK